MDSWSTHYSKKEKLFTKYMTYKFLQESVSLPCRYDTKLKHLTNRPQVNKF